MSGQITHGILLAAGRGSRLKTLTGGRDKAMIPVGYPQEHAYAERTEGVPIIEISFANLALAGIEHIAVVQNQNREIEQNYGTEFDTEEILTQQGRWRENLKGKIARQMSVSYTVQPNEFYHNDQARYGTGIWPLLLGKQIENWIQNGAKQFLVSEADSLPYSPNGGTPITKLVKTAEKNPDSAAILLMPINPDASPEYGHAFVEEVEGQQYFLGVQETEHHPLLVAKRGGDVQKYKNVTRAVINIPLYRRMQENAETEPPAVNKGETHILDGYRSFIAYDGEIAAVISDPDDLYINFGDPKSLQHADKILRGLRQDPPVWDFRLAA